MLMSCPFFSSRVLSLHFSFTIILINVIGAMYLEARNSNAVVMDKRGFDNYRVLESSHPYESAMPTGGVAFVILSETVDGGANCSAWNLHFEETTETYFTDRFTIYDDSVNLNIIFSAGTDWPGTNLPSLRIARSSFYVEFVGPTSTQYAPASLSMNLYGFKLYCAPVYSDVNSYDKTIFRENTAPTRYFILCCCVS